MLMLWNTLSLETICVGSNELLLQECRVQFTKRERVILMEKDLTRAMEPYKNESLFGKDWEELFG
jgi:hypothetical protein